MVTRITGLASGLDIDTMVADLMRAERIPLDKLKQERQVWEWKQEDYRTINTSLAALREQAFTMKMEGAFMVKSGTSSDIDVVTVTAGNSAAEGIYSVTVNTLAKGVFKASTAELTDEYKDATSTKTLWEQFQAELTARGFASTDSISFTLNGTAIALDLDVDNINTVVSKINSEDLDVQASYDTTLNRFFLTTTATGSATEITVTADSANFLSTSANASILKLSLNTATTYNGVDASVDVGDAVGLTFSTNTVTVAGLNLNLKQEGASATVTVTRDTDAVFNAIQAFVTSYNQTIDTVYDKLGGKRYLDYPPLTDEQRKEMSDNEIELWEEKARSGLLKNESLIDNIVAKVRTSASSRVSGLTNYLSLADIGITTKTYKYNGQMQIDSTKLRAALNNNMDAVMELFTVTSDDNDSANEGIAARMYTDLVNGIDWLSERAGSTSGFSLVDDSVIGKKLVSFDTDIRTWEDRLKTTEDRYWRKFTAMENAISQMNSVSAWLTQQMGLSGNQ